MTDLGPLAERLRKVEDHTQTIDKDALVKFGEGLDGRVLEKVIVALEARLTEHVGQVDRRLAEIDAQVALDLKAVDTHTAAQTSAVEKAIQQIDAQVRDYVAAAQQSSAEQISGVDQKLSALQEALPAKFREIIEAVRQSMEARVALELSEVETRVSSRGVAPERLQELESNLRDEVAALSDRLSTEMRGLAEERHSETAPLQQALQQLETKLTTLREELPPKIRQIVETVESAMSARIADGDRQAADRMAGLEHGLSVLREEMPTAAGFQQTIDDSLRSHAEQVGVLDRKLTVLQEELPPKIKAIVDAVRESLDARMAVELRGIEERHNAQIQQSQARLDEAQEQIRQQLASESKTPEIERSVATMQADVSDMRGRLEASSRDVADHMAGVEQRAASSTAGVTAELELLRSQHLTQIEKLENAVSGLRESLETKLATEIHDLEARTAERSPDLEKALQYASILEARVQALEQKLQRSAEETVDKAVERVWEVLESRLQQRQAQAPPAKVQPVESVSGLRQKSTSAEQSVLDLIAGIGQLFEKPTPKSTSSVSQMHVVPEPAVLPPAAVAAPVLAPHVEAAPVALAPAEPAVSANAASPVEPEPVVAEYVEPEPAAVEAPVFVMREPVAKPPEMAAETSVDEIAEPRPDGKPPVILFKPKEAGRKWRIPFVSSFLLMAVAIAWLEFM
jgi:uncharacterized protein YktB (UPF0637 family)